MHLSLQTHQRDSYSQTRTPVLRNYNPRQNIFGHWRKLGTKAQAAILSPNVGRSVNPSSPKQCWVGWRRPKCLKCEGGGGGECVIFTSSWVSVRRVLTRDAASLEGCLLLVMECRNNIYKGASDKDTQPPRFQRWTQKDQEAKLSQRRPFLRHSCPA